MTPDALWQRLWDEPTAPYLFVSGMVIDQEVLVWGVGEHAGRGLHHLVIGRLEVFPHSNSQDLHRHPTREVCQGASAGLLLL